MLADIYMAEAKRDHRTKVSVPDNQKLILRDELQKLWQGRDVFAEVQSLEGSVAREVPGRQTIRFVLGGQAYYRKLHTGVGWGEIFKNLVRLRLPIIGARNEWLALNLLADIGVPSLVPVAYGEKFSNPARRLSFVVTRELANVEELDKYLLSHRQQEFLSFSEKHLLVAELARITRAIHNHGINHRDLYLCHFLLDVNSIARWQQGQPPVLHLVDLHRAQIRAKVPARWLIKDLASIYFSAMDLGVTRGDLARFLQVYFAQPLAQIVKERSALLRQLEQRAVRLYQREQRLKARGLRD